jgi:hypothetical protein
MRTKSTSPAGFLSLRSITILFCATAACSILTVPLLAFLRSQEQVNGSQRTLSFEERVSYQKAIEEVYWRHRICPKERPDPKPSLDAVMSQTQLEKKVTDYLRNSQALEDYWQRPITAKQLQAEMDRVAKHTKQSEILHELFEALGNDPFVIAECLARPALAERLLTNWYAYDERIHSELRRRAEAELHAHLPAVASAQAGPIVEQMKQLSGKYSEIELIRSNSADDANPDGGERGPKLNGREWDETVQKLATILKSGTDRMNAQRCSHAVSNPVEPENTATKLYETIPVGKVSTLQEDKVRYYATAVIGKSEDHLKLAIVSWPKQLLDSWLVRGENEVRTALSAPSGSYSFPNVADTSAGYNPDTDGSRATAARTTARATPTPRPRPTPAPRPAGIGNTWGATP